MLTLAAAAAAVAASATSSTTTRSNRIKVDDDVSALDLASCVPKSVVKLFTADEVTIMNQYLNGQKPMDELTATQLRAQFNDVREAESSSGKYKSLSESDVTKYIWARKAQKRRAKEEMVETQQLAKLEKYFNKMGAVKEEVDELESKLESVFIDGWIETHKDEARTFRLKSNDPFSKTKYFYDKARIRDRLNLTLGERDQLIDERIKYYDATRMKTIRSKLIAKRLELEAAQQKYYELKHSMPSKVQIKAQTSENQTVEHEYGTILCAVYGLHLCQGRAEPNEMVVLTRIKTGRDLNAIRVDNIRQQPCGLLNTDVASALAPLIDAGLVRVEATVDTLKAARTTREEEMGLRIDLYGKRSDRPTVERHLHKLPQVTYLSAPPKPKTKTTKKRKLPSTSHSSTDTRTTSRSTLGGTADSEQKTSEEDSIQSRKKKAKTSPSDRDS